MVRPIFPHLGFQTHHYLSSPVYPSPSSIYFAEYRFDLHVRPTWCPSARPATTLCLESVFSFTSPQGSKCLFWLTVQNVQCCTFCRQSIFWYRDSALFVVITPGTLPISPISRDTCICAPKQKLMPGSLSPRTDSL